MPMIDEILLQASTTGKRQVWFTRAEVEHAAELIVRECANVAADMQALDIYEEIREHFGVEE